MPALGPDLFFPAGTYLSMSDGNPRVYYADVPWAHAVKTIIAGVDIETVTSNGQVALNLEYTFDGVTWQALTTPLIADTSTSDLNVGDNGSQVFGNRARLSLSVSASTGSAQEGVVLNGVWASGKPF